MRKVASQHLWYEKAMQLSPFTTTADWPRPSGPLLESAELQPADVLLSRGQGNISDAIVSADGGSYSHSALWSGSSIIEARQDGVRERALEGDRDVYRFVNAAGPLAAQSAEQIVDVARSKVGGDYAFNELYLLGALFAFGIMPERSLLGRALDLLGGAEAEHLERWLTGLRFARMPVVCTELVALAFYEARVDGALALRVLPRAARPARPGEHRPRSWPGPDRQTHDSPDTDRLQQRCRQLLRAGSRDEEEQREGSRKVLWGTVALGADSGTKLSVVTPADLQFSPSLRFVGRVQAPASSSEAHA